MTKNPLINALVALTYIVTIASAMFYGTKNLPGPDTVIAPIAAISLFTLSAAIMGYLFLYQPFQLYFAGKKKEGLDLFLQTTLVFGGITIVILFLLFSGLLS
jgi:hypothetical protein